jgi:hypothetical protein
MQATGIPFLYTTFFAAVASLLHWFEACPLPLGPGLLLCWVGLIVQPMYTKIYFGVKRDLFVDVIDLLDMHVATMIIAYIQHGDLQFVVSLWLGVPCPASGLASASGSGAGVALVLLFGYMRHALWVLLVQMGVRQAKPFVQELMHTDGTLEAEFMKQTLEADQRVFGPVMKNRGKPHRGGQAGGQV